MQFPTGNLGDILASDCLGRVQQYTLNSNIHFHARGEHKINGVQPDACIHMVFTRTSNPTHEDEIAVIEIQFRKNSSAPSGTVLLGDSLLRGFNINNPEVFNCKKINLKKANNFINAMRKIAFFIQIL